MECELLKINISYQGNIYTSILEKERQSSINYLYIRMKFREFKVVVKSIIILFILFYWLRNILNAERDVVDYIYCNHFQ